MTVHVGDRIRIESERAGQSGRAGLIEEVLSEQPQRLRVRWRTDGQASSPRQRESHASSGPPPSTQAKTADRTARTRAADNPLGPTPHDRARPSRLTNSASAGRTSSLTDERVLFVSNAGTPPPRRRRNRRHPRHRHRAPATGSLTVAGLRPLRLEALPRPSPRRGPQLPATCTSCGETSPPPTTTPASPHDAGQTRRSGSEGHSRSCADGGRRRRARGIGLRVRLVACAADDGCRGYFSGSSRFDRAGRSGLDDLHLGKDTEAQRLTASSGFGLSDGSTRAAADYGSASRRPRPEARSPFSRRRTS